MKYYIKRHSHRIKKGILGLAIISVSYFGLRYFLNSRGVVVSTDDTSSSENIGADDVTGLKSKVLNFGASSWAESESESVAQTSMLGSFEKFNRTDYGTWVGNLNCFITEKKSAESCGESTVSSYSKWFNVVALGGLDDSTVANDTYTIDKLAKNNIQFFGRTPKSKVPEDCEIVALPAYFVLKDQSQKQATMPLVLCAVDGEKTMLVDISTEIKRYSEYLPVWVYALDSGNASDIDSQSQYRSYIDAGADLVIGAANTDLGTSEVYANKLIIYSLGRFIGPSKSTTSLNAAALVSVDISASNDELIEWDKIAKTCSGYDDLCLDATLSLGLKKLTYEYTYGIVAVDNSNVRSPVVADAALTADILAKLKWFDTSALLGVKD